jgi:hypothetical protein
MGNNNMPTESIIGKRNNKRFQILNCRVQLKSKGILGLFGKELHHLSLVNLSTAGMQAISSKMLRNKKEYDIAIVAPAFRYPISARGRVVWNRPCITHDQQHYYRVGLEFTYFKGQAMDKIESLKLNPRLREI